jgi:hypothetical protein
LLEGPSDGLSQVNLAFMVTKLFCLGSYKNVNLVKGNVGEDIERHQNKNYFNAEAPILWLQNYSRLGLNSLSRNLILKVIQTSKIWFKLRLVIETHIWSFKTPNQTYTYYFCMASIGL